MSGSTKAAVELLSPLGITVLESIVIDELCEFRGRDNLADITNPDGTPFIVTPLVRTVSDDGIARRRLFCC